MGWNQLRGPNGSGVGEGLAPPIKIEAKTAAWKVPVAPGLSSPVLSKNRIFLTALENDRLVTIAFDKASGEVVWRKEAPKTELEKVHKANGPATPTPLVDGKRLYVYFGSYGLLCYDHDGAELWSKPIPTPKSLYGASSSPIEHGDNLILVIDNDRNLPDSKLSQSRVVAFKKATGEIDWETPRHFVRSGWSTPMIWTHHDGEELVILGTGRVDSYDPKTGKEKWFATGFSRETIAMPIAGNGNVYISSAQLGGGADENVDPKPFWDAVMRFDKNGDEKVDRSEMTEHFTFPLRPELPLGHPGYGIPLPKNEKARMERQIGMFGWVDKDKDGFWTKEELYGHLTLRRGRPILMAIRPGGEGDITGTSFVAWELRKSIPEIPSPLFHENRIYMVRNGGLLAAVDAVEGELLYRERLGSTGQYSASPVAANGHLYLASNRGLISVVKMGDTFEVVHEHDLDDPVFVTPAMDATTLYLRSEGSLWSFRKMSE